MTNYVDLFKLAFKITDIEHYFPLVSNDETRFQIRLPVSALPRKYESALYVPTIAKFGITDIASIDDANGLSARLYFDASEIKVNKNDFFNFLSELSHDFKSVSRKDSFHTDITSRAHHINQLDANPAGAGRYSPEHHIQRVEYPSTKGRNQQPATALARS